MNVSALPADGDYYRKRICHYALATETADLSNMTALAKQYIKAFAFMCLPLKMMLMAL